jgi:hypothetical protein
MSAEALKSYLEKLSAEYSTRLDVSFRFKEAANDVERLTHALQECDYGDILDFYAAFQYDVLKAFEGFPPRTPEELEVARLHVEFKREIIDGLRRICGAK